MESRILESHRPPDSRIRAAFVDGDPWPSHRTPHKRTVPSALPTTSVSPLGERSTLSAEPVSPENVCTSVPLPTSRSSTKGPFIPTATIVPSGDRATLKIHTLSPGKVKRSL